MKKFLILFLFLFHVKSFCLSYFSVNDFFVNSIYKNNNLVSYIKLYKYNSLIYKKDILNLIKRLYLTNNFLNVNYKFLNKNQIIIYLNYRPIIDNILFIGNSLFKNKDLIYFFSQFNIKSGVFYNNDSLLNAKKFIINKYKFLGKYNVKLFFKIFFINKNNYLLKVFIYENNFYKINNIFFSGNKFINDKKLISILDTKNYNFLKCIFYDCIYRVSNLYIDLYNIKKEYFNYGYFNFFVKTIKIIILNNNKLNLYLEFYEGDRYRISDIVIFINNLSNNNFIDVLNDIKFIFFHKNILYDVNILNKIIYNIKFFFNRNGYVNLDFSIDVRKFNNKIKIFFYFKLNKLFYVNNIIFVGNKLYKKSFLMNKIPNNIIGKLYNEYLINLGKQYLLKTNLFSFVKWKIKFHDINYSNKLDIIYYLSENNNNLFNFKFGYGKKSYLNYEFDFLRKNILNFSNDFFLRILNNKFTKYGSVFLEYPINKHKNIFIKHKLIYNNLFNNSNDLYGYLNSSWSLDNSMMFILDKNIKYNIGLNYIHNSFYDIKPQLNILNYYHYIGKKFNFWLNKNSLINNDVFLFNNLIFNNLNDLFFPNSGMYWNLSFKNTLFKSKNNFYKIYLSLSKYFNFNKNILLYLHFNFGYGNSFLYKMLPFYENFYFDDYDVLRSFNLNNLGPRNVLFNSINFKCLNKKKLCLSKNISGGNLIFLLNTEITIPNEFFLTDKNNKYFRVSFFIDSGFISDSNWRNTILNRKNNIPDYSNIINFLKSSFGLSTKILTPFGPINVSYGIPIVYDKNDEINNFQFSLGNFL